jgi:hypothetical protein
MVKFYELFNKIEIFCTNALCEYLFIKKANSTLLQKSNNFDIKNEDLFNQFESFMDAYKELVNLLEIDAKNLASESFEDAGQLIDTLNKRYERIMSNNYLNVIEDFDEDFDPADLSEFIQTVVLDAENKLKTIAGDELDLDAMRAAQYAQEFNDNKNIDRGDPNITWTGNKVQQNLEARKRYFQNLMFIKKIGKSHPEYARYERYIQNRRENFKRFLSNLRDNDPASWREYQNKMNERVRKHYHKNIEKFKEKSKIKADKIRELKQSGSLKGTVTTFAQQLASTKSDAIKKQIKKDPVFTPYKQAVAEAKRNLNSNASSENKQALEKAIKTEAAFMQNYISSNSIILAIVSDLKTMYSYRDKMKKIIESGWVSDAEVPEEVKPILNEIINEGKSLIQNFQTQYKTPCESISKIVQYLSNKL